MWWISLKRPLDLLSALTECEKTVMVSNDRSLTNQKDGLGNSFTDQTGFLRSSGGRNNKENNSVLAGRLFSLPGSFWLSSLPFYGQPRRRNSHWASNVKTVKECTVRTETSLRNQSAFRNWKMNEYMCTFIKSVRSVKTNVMTIKLLRSCLQKTLRLSFQSTIGKSALHQRNML